MNQPVKLLNPVVMLPNNPGRQPRRIVPTKNKPGKLLNYLLSFLITRLS